MTWSVVLAYSNARTPFSHTGPIALAVELTNPDNLYDRKNPWRSNLQTYNLQRVIYVTLRLNTSCDLRDTRSSA
jgi:hypothetical protein